MEIVFPEVKPEIEWVRGRALQKMSPTYWHGLAQRRIATALGAWAESHNSGRVATEWRFRVTPPGDVTRPLVPDVAFVSYEVLPKAAPAEDVGVPLLAPTVAVQILSPDDRAEDVLDKIETYLAAGTVAILEVDPIRHTVVIHDAVGQRCVAGGESVVLAALPGFSLGLEDLFA